MPYYLILSFIFFECNIYFCLRGVGTEQVKLIQQEIERDLKPGDIRKTLIEYSSEPKAEEEAHTGTEKKADSPFEDSVADALADSGYHIVRQWKVGSYRLDIVAVCGKKKVVVECDGERRHCNEEKIREDMERQTILERLGLRFIRIRGSEFYKDPEKTIGNVISVLAGYGIEPEDPEQTTGHL